MKYTVYINMIFMKKKPLSWFDALLLKSGNFCNFWKHKYYQFVILPGPIQLIFYNVKGKIFFY